MAAESGRPAAGSRPANRAGYAAGLAGVLIGAALLRLAGIGFGLPHLYHWDERGYFHATFYALATGGQAESLVPGNLPYLLALPVWAVAAAHSLPLWGSGISRVVALYLDDPTPFYLLGRITWVGLQLVAIWLVYRVGSAALSRRAGLLGAAFLGVAFLAVSEGHYIKGDTTAMLGAVLCAAAAMRLLERPDARSYALLGAAVGLTVAFKFYMYTLAVLPLVAHLIVWSNWANRIRKWWYLLVSAALAALAFVVALPAFALDPLGTWGTLKVEAGVRLSSVSTGGVPYWLYYWVGHLWDGLGWPLEVCGLAGFALWLVRRDPRRLVLLAIPALVWVGISSRDNEFARYTLPLVPFLALAAGDLLDRAAHDLAGFLDRAPSTEYRVPSRIRTLGTRYSVLGTAVAATIIALPSLLNDLRFAVYASSPDTRTIAARWVETHIPAGATIVEEGGQGFEAIPNLGAPLRADPAVAGDAAGDTWQPTQLKPYDEFWRVPLLAWLETYTPTYKMTFAPTLTRYKERLTTADWGYPDAFVMLSWRSDPEKATPPWPIWDDLRKNYVQSARFDCSPCFPNDPYAWAMDYSSLAQVRLFSDRNVAGPRIWVYTRRPR